MDVYGGSGRVLRDLAQLPTPIAGGINVTLSDLRDKNQIRVDEEHSLYLIDGSVYREETWTRVSEQIQQLGASGVDIILVRPEHGWLINDATPRPEVVAMVIRQLWTLLSQDGGSLFVQLPPFYTVKKFNPYYEAIKKWMKDLKERGFDTDLNIWGDAVLRINRTQADAEYLPELGISSA